jgi:hypothetical protein
LNRTGGAIGAEKTLHERPRPLLIAGSMASTFAVTRKHLIFGICLPLALLLGYLLADPADPVTILFVMAAIGIMCVPLLLHWYHPLLILCWNLGAYPALPGRPALWAMFALVSIVLLIINCSFSGENRFMPAPTLAWPLLVLLGIVLTTGYFTGSLGLASLGASSMGGKNYFYITAAVAGFFVLGSKSIPPDRAAGYVSVFFLSSLVSLVSLAALFLGSAGEPVYYLFPPEGYALVGSASETIGQLSAGSARFVCIREAGLGLLIALLARYGVEGVFNWTRPWRLGVFLLAIAAGAFGGFRSTGIAMAIVFFGLMWVEKIWRSRTVLLIAVLGFLGMALLIGFSDKLPDTVQRTLSFLPIKVDPFVASSAEVSTDWRLEMWKEAWRREVPEYWLKGKGYSINSDDLYMSTFSKETNLQRSWEWALTAGDYHNGPLSLLIPFGVWGLIAFLWLVIAGFRYLLMQHRTSPPELRQINALLLALFAGRAVFFFGIYGALPHDLMHFTGILGLSVALNAHRRATVAEPVVTGLQPAAQE